MAALNASGVAPADAPALAAALTATALATGGGAAAAAWRPDDAEAPATQCAVCWSAHVRVLLLPCAHLCICGACDAGLLRRICPLCREPIQGTINARFP